MELAWEICLMLSGNLKRHLVSYLRVAGATTMALLMSGHGKNVTKMRRFTRACLVNQLYTHLYTLVSWFLGQYCQRN